MRLIPVLDLRGGGAVHARGGDRSRYAPVASRLAPNATPGDAAAIARAYAACGARSIYVADLDAIEGRPAQEALVISCAHAAGSGSGLWIDAGITTPAIAERWSAVGGIERLVVGLETLSGASALADIVGAVEPGRVAFSVDLRNGVPDARVDALRAMPPIALADMAVGAGAACVVLLDLARVGTGGGVDEPLAQEIARRIAPAELVVGGGIPDLGVVRRLSALGVQGALVASALHDGRIDGRALAPHDPFA